MTVKELIHQLASLPSDEVVHIVSVDVLVGADTYSTLDDIKITPVIMLGSSYKMCGSTPEPVDIVEQERLKS